MHKTMMIFAIIALAIVLGGCQENLTDQQIKQKLIEANSNLNTYSADINMDISSTISVMDESGDLKITMDGKIDVNQETKQMAMTGEMRMDLSGLPEASDTVPQKMDMETYISEGYLYSKFMGAWMKVKLDEKMWDQQNQIGHYLEYVDSGSIERLQDETIEGTGYYVVKIKPNMQDVLEYALKQQSQTPQDMDLNDLNWEDLITDFSSKIWINKETFIIERSEESISLLMTPENMGALGADMDYGEMRMDLDTSTKIYNINKDIEIIVPEEAENAIDMSALEEQMSNIDADEPMPIPIEG